MECFYLPARRSKRRRIIQVWTSGIAAAIVVLVVLIVPRITNEDTIQDIEIFAALDVPEAIITSESNGRITLSTPPATTTQIILDDGTQVTLNANSRLEYPKQFPAEGTREVHLTGEARFEVAKIVHALSLFLPVRCRHRYWARYSM